MEARIREKRRQIDRKLQQSELLKQTKEELDETTNRVQNQTVMEHLLA